MKKSLVLMLTDACNCDCSYCYQKVDRKKSIGKLGMDAINNIEALLPEIESIQFFGGEPLMAEDIIFALDAKIDLMLLEHRLSRKPAYVFSSNLVFFSDKFKEFLLKLKNEDSEFRFIITVDGMEVVHDQNRVLQNGQGTYKMILGNYAFLMEHSMDCVKTIYVVYNQTHIKNGNSLQDCVADISKHFPTASSVIFNWETCFEKTKISEMDFFNEKYDLMLHILEEIVNGGDVYKNCRPFLRGEIIALYSSISEDLLGKKRCIQDGKKLAIIPNGEVFLCVDQYYGKEKPLTVLGQKNIPELLGKVSLLSNKKAKACENCPVRTLCHICPMKEQTEEVCLRNKRYYMMVLSYLKQAYSSPERIRRFIEYAGVSDQAILGIYNYLKGLGRHAEL